MDLDIPICKRCEENAGAYLLRNEANCPSCFDYYIRSKCIKRMERYRICANDPSEIPTLLLPVSFGVSSTVLLHLIDGQLRAQRQRVTRFRYKLKMVHIDESILGRTSLSTAVGEEVSSCPSLQALEKLREKYPDAGEYLLSRLEDIYDFATDDETAALLNHTEGSDHNQDVKKNNTESMRALLLALPSPTSREDVAGIFRMRLIVAIAKHAKCEGILWGDSTTRLADKIMAEAAKGRGFSLPWHISDKQSLYGVTFYHPLRDLFKKELVTYAFEITQPSLIPLCGAYSSIPKHSPAAATSGRNITVGELMTQYFDSMEVQYPSTVSNVVRMGDRLKPSSSKTKTCSLCGLFIDEGANDLTLGAQGQQVEAGEMCYGCMRSTHGASRLASLLTINLGS